MAAATVESMAEEWIVRVQGKEYGPADLESLREWKREGRVLATNEARRVDASGWSTAAKIPGLFEITPPPVQLQVAEQESADARDQRDHLASDIQHRSLPKILAQTLAIYRAGFFQFLSLTLLTVLPSVCGQLTTAFIETTPNVDVDLRSLVVSAFAFCMLVLTIVLWPIYIASIQVLTAEFAAGRRIGFFAALNQAVRFWPRVAALCIFVYGVFFLLTAFGVGIAAMMMAAPGSLVTIVLALGLLGLQVWLFGRFFINVLFWQQFAVLENAGVADSLRLSKELARSGDYLPWFRRPKWRGAVIASLWFAFVLAIMLLQEWPAVQDYFHTLMTTQDPQALLQKLTAAQQAHGFDLSRFGLSLLQRILQPLLGIAFVLLYLDSRFGRTSDTHSTGGEIDDHEGPSLS
jgi:hypothetical protein